MKLKEIIEYILRIGLFLLLNRKFAISITIPILQFLSKNLNTDNAIILSILIWIIYLYISLKICGLFKKLDNLNFLNSLIFVIILNLIFNYSINTTVQIIPFKISYTSGSFLYIIIIYFIYYRILNWLGKKYPNTFGKIGYYFSIECYKNLFKKLKNSK